MISTAAVQHVMVHAYNTPGSVCIIALCLFVMLQSLPLSSRVYSNLIYFFNHGDEDIQIKTVKGLGMPLF